MSSPNILARPMPSAATLVAKSATVVDQLFAEGSAKFSWAFTVNIDVRSGIFGGHAFAPVQAGHFSARVNRQFTQGTVETGPAGTSKFALKIKNQKIIIKFN